ncbi:zinc-dependent peptidase [Mongoliitalea daihaiensis]|uniref:zinc-dependent peptidase n=1 Tax=Mongoliitalea daihaiensis TaxID=2782006 RepID=UPI001F48BAEF|nr:zinc-dependent peptidase [Mongoliitalea daihaiensis]UJP65287.1 zinc-dependent peptidase [Mongoliitalea daihaiensis]
MFLFSFLLDVVKRLYLGYRNVKYKLLGIELSFEQKDFLRKFFPYYAGLSPEHQKEFEERVFLFLEEKKIIPRGSLQEVPLKVKLLIAATAVKVSFGFRDFRFEYFDKILVYPDSYYSAINQRYHFGEVNPKLRIIVLSLVNFLEGVADPISGRNLGIHEIAHALKLENQIHFNNGSVVFNPTRWKAYTEHAYAQMDKIARGEQHTIFRAYAGTNKHEFFAVALELFFEKSAELKAYNPELYQSLVYLLKQDPMVLVRGDGR